MFAVIAHQLRRHAFHLSAVEHVQEQRLQDIVAVMTQRNFGGAQLRRGPVQNATTQTRAESRWFALRDLLFYDTVGVFFDDFVLNAQLIEIFRQDMLRETRLFLVKVYGHKGEFHRRALLKITQDLQHGVAVFTPDRQTMMRSPSSIILKSAMASPTLRRSRFCSLFRLYCSFFVFG